MHKKLNFLSLTCILGGSFGIPVMVIGGELSKLYGPGTALSSILIGNFILWLLGLAILSMAKKGFNALENIKYYLGKKIVHLISLLWIFAFVLWFVVRLRTTSETISPEYKWIFGGTLGLITALLSMRGLEIIRKISFFLFPCLFLLALYFMGINNNPIQFDGTWGISLIGILTVIFVWIPITLNLPTVFKFSLSKADSLMGLTLITISHVFFQIFAIFTGFDHQIQSGSLASLVYLFSSILGNLLNIYFAKSGWDMISEKIKDGPKYLMIGIAGTALFIFSPKFFSSQSLEEILVNFLVILGVVLLFDFFIRAFVQHRPRPLERFSSSLCWIAGCFISMVVKMKIQFGPEKTTMIGVIACSLIFLLLIFIEETIWSVKKIIKREYLE